MKSLKIENKKSSLQRTESWRTTLKGKRWDQKKSMKGGTNNESRVRFK